ncbi:MAG: site-specific DNA-methyltransferase [Clostridia bacterium]|nr:site-specific DNA-methyltransferase [Clostridia bacterium]
MLKRIDCSGELHMIGGDGTVWCADLRDIEDSLLDRYRGTARIVYIDPPFGTGGAFEFRRGRKQIAYTDKLPEEEHIALIREAAKLAHALLADDGTFFLHVDYRLSAKCRLLCDEIFGADNLANEIIWAYKSGGRSKNAFSKKHDTILMYRKGEEAYFDIEAVGVPRGPERRNHMRRGTDEDGRVFYSIRTGGKEYRYYEDDLVYPSDVWDDIEHLHQRDPERTGFVTQKPEALMRRMILSCSREGDTVIDLFGGSGTTAAAAAKLGRRYVTVDCGRVAAAVTRRRLIERCLKMRLYDSVSPMTVENEPETGCEIDPAAYLDMEEKDGLLILTLKKLPADRTPYYAAVGTVKDGVFSAFDYSIGVKPGEKTVLKKGECLHLVNEDMDQAFFLYE